MKKILLAVDDSRSSLKTSERLLEIFKRSLPDHLVLVHVEKIEGASVMDDLLLSDSEIETLKDSLQGTEHQDDLDRRAHKVIKHFCKFFTDRGIAEVESMVLQGHPAEEILAAAENTGAELIAIGTRSRRLHNLFMGSVSREVADKARVPVLLLR